VRIEDDGKKGEIGKARQGKTFCLSTGGLIRRVSFPALEL
jgi:hypothetical protein